jgi:hypothetical protein
MALSRPGRAVLGYTSALLLGGILGLACWSWLRHSGRDRASRIGRFGVALAAGGLVLIAVGTVWRVVVAIQSLPACSGPPSQQAQTSGRHIDAALLGEKFATWPETGLAMLYARAIGAPECRSRSTDYYVAIHANELTGGRAVNLGDIVLSPLYDISKRTDESPSPLMKRGTNRSGRSGPSSVDRSRSQSRTPSTTSSSPGHATTSSAKPAWNQADTAMWATGRY